MEEFDIEFDINNKLKLYQFSEKYLIKNLNFFNSNVCLEYQNNLTPYFCFRYLYNNITEPLKNRVYYNNIIEYFRKTMKYNEKFIDIYNKIFDICMNERLNSKNKLSEIKITNKTKDTDTNNKDKDNDNDTIKPLFNCNAKCNKCLDKYCDY